MKNAMKCKVINSNFTKFELIFFHSFASSRFHTRLVVYEHHSNREQRNRTIYDQRNVNHLREAIKQSKIFQISEILLCRLWPFITWLTDISLTQAKSKSIELSILFNLRLQPMHSFNWARMSNDLTRLIENENRKPKQNQQFICVDESLIDLPAIGDSNEDDEDARINRESPIFIFPFLTQMKSAGVVVVDSNARLRSQVIEARCTRNAIMMWETCA